MGTSGGCVADVGPQKGQATFHAQNQAQLTYVTACQRVKRTIEKVEQRLNVEPEDLLQGPFPPISVLGGEQN